MHSTMTVVIALSCSLTSAAADTPNAPNHHLRQLRFSPDGRYVLAQDDSWVTILTVKPLAVLFRAPAENAGSAEITPDSQDVVFVSSARYVERWHVANSTRIGRIEVKLPPCKTERLSLDGRAIACVDSEGTLALADLVSGAVVLWKKKLGTGSIDRGWYSSEDVKGVVTYSGERGSARIAFSPDGRFFIAVPVVYDSSCFAWDRYQNRAVKLKGGLKRVRWAEEDGLETPHFVFVASDRLVISPRWAEGMIEPATEVAFPSGKLISKLKLPPGALYPATDSGFVIVRPYGRYTPPPSAMQAFASEGFRMVYPYSQDGAVAVEMSTGQVIESETPALDVLGRYYVAELPNGEIGLYERGKGLQAVVSLKAR
jgi:hypothetical protein